MRRRSLHYLVAHRLLPEQLFAAPNEVLNALQEAGAGYVRSVWNQALRETDAIAEAAPNEGIACQLQQIGAGLTLAVITFPIPAKLTEPFFTAIAFPAAQGRGSHQDLVRYFMLELTSAGDEPLATTLCEWTEKRRHINYGHGPSEPTIAGFFEAISTVLRNADGFWSSAVSGSE